MKILILKPSSLGDVVQALPVLRLLKAHNPGHEIYWWISRELADLVQDDPDLSGVFIFDRRRWAFPQHWGEVVGSISQMRAHHFDCVIDLQALARSSLVAWLTQANLTVGLQDWREGAPVLYDLAAPRPSPLTHAVDWYLEVLKILQVPIHWNFTWIPERTTVAKQVRARADQEGARWLMINPGARWENKRWPVESYAQMLRTLAAQGDHFRFAILGSAADQERGAALAQVCPKQCLDLTGRTSLLELIEWIRLSELIVTNDTGPMHIAAALGKRVVSIFGPTEPRRTGPYGQIENAVRIDLPCAPCLKPTCHYVKPMECLRGISPSAVIAKVRQALSHE